MGGGKGTQEQARYLVAHIGNGPTVRVYVHRGGRPTCLCTDEPSHSYTQTEGSARSYTGGVGPLVRKEVGPLIHRGVCAVESNTEGSAYSYMKDWPTFIHRDQPYTVKKAMAECAKLRCWQRRCRTKGRGSRNFPTPTSFGSRHRCPHRNFAKLFLQCTRTRSDELIMVRYAQAWGPLRKQEAGGCAEGTRKRSLKYTCKNDKV
jgi:hypothetical protein